MFKVLLFNVIMQLFQVSNSSFNFMKTGQKKIKMRIY